jgi:hypothetical protein
VANKVFILAISHTTHPNPFSPSIPAQTIGWVHVRFASCELTSQPFFTSTRMIQTTQPGHASF